MQQLKTHLSLQEIGLFCCFIFIKLKTVYSDCLLSPSPPSIYMLRKHIHTHKHARWIQTRPPHQRREDWRQSHYDWAAICDPLLAASSAHPDRSKRYWQLNKFSAWNHVSSSMLPTPPTLWPTEVLNNYISFQRLIWLKAIILAPDHHSCFHTLNIDIDKWKWNIVALYPFYVAGW